MIYALPIANSWFSNLISYPIWILINSTYMRGKKPLTIIKSPFRNIFFHSFSHSCIHSSSFIQQNYFTTCRIADKQQSKKSETKVTSGFYWYHFRNVVFVNGNHYRCYWCERYVRNTFIKKICLDLEDFGTHFRNIFVYCYCYAVWDLLDFIIGIQVEFSHYE